MEEAFTYANNWNTWSESGFYCPLVDSVIPDQNGWDDPQDSVNICFSDTLLSLSGISGIVKESKTIDDRSYTLCGPLTIDSNTTITLEGGTYIYMINDTANITVDEGASLVCQDGYSYFTGVSEENNITINGSFTPGGNNTFDHVPEIILNNPNAHTHFHNVTFTDTTILKNYGDSLSIDSSLVENCLGVYSFASDIYISNTRFVNSSMVVSNSDETTSHSVTVEDCEFDYLSSNAMAAIKLMCCDEFFIEDNEISNYDKGIEAWYSGEGTSGNQLISGNEIDETDNGILLYNTIATVAGNNIYNNEYGVRFLSISNVEFKGDSMGDIQYISNNDSYEVYCSEQSFPWYFRFNETSHE